MTNDIVSILKTCNVEGDPKSRGFFTRLLLSVRACVLPATWTAIFIGTFLSLHEGAFNWFYFVLLFLSMTFAHMTNNLLNDYFDWKYGIDTEDYVRAQYSPHPILHGLFPPRTIVALAALFTLIDFAIMVYFYLVRGLLIVLLAVTGFFLSFSYAGPPLKLKYHGLGEISNFLVWGPLMTLGVYFVFTGHITLRAVLLSIPYGVLMFYSLAGKHLDKIDEDRPLGLKTLPIILGVKNTKKLIKFFVWFNYVYITLLVLFGYMSVWGLLVLLTVPKALTVNKILSMDKPEKNPFVSTVSGIAAFLGAPSILKGFDFDAERGNWPIWPLWYIAWLFSLSKSFGYMFILALLLEILFPWNLNVLVYMPLLKQLLSWLQ